MVHPFSPTAEGICRENLLPEGQRNFNRKLSHAFALSFRSSLLHVSFSLNIFRLSLKMRSDESLVPRYQRQGTWGFIPPPPFGSLVGLGWDRSLGNSCVGRHYTNRSNTRNDSLLTLYSGQFTFSTQLLTLNYLLYSPTDVAPQFL